MDAGIYAKALHLATKDVDSSAQKERFAQFLSVLKNRGHEALLPQILSVYERELEEKGKRTILTVASEKDAQKALKELESHKETFDLEHLETVVDDSLIGGFVVRNQDTILDQSYRRALIGLYQKVTS